MPSTADARARSRAGSRFISSRARSTSPNGHNRQREDKHRYGAGVLAETIHAPLFALGLAQRRALARNAVPRLDEIAANQ